MDTTEPDAPESPPGQSTPRTTEENTLIPRSGPTSINRDTRGHGMSLSTDAETTSGQEIENSGPYTTPFSSYPKATSELPLTSTSWSETTEGTAQQTSAISENEASDTDNTTASIDTGLNEVRPSVDFGPSGVLVNGGVGVEMRNYTVRYPGVIKDN
ncbi:hypothetical protein MRX96_023449 [Rhipicephalus microplus]